MVLGITSWGATSCRDPFGYYTAVADHLAWLEAGLKADGAAPAALAASGDQAAAAAATTPFSGGDAQAGSSGPRNQNNQ